MFVLKNAEELNKLFLRNKEMDILLNVEDRNLFHYLINEISEDGCSHLLQTFLTLQVNKTIQYFSGNINYGRIFNISGESLFH